MSKMKFISFKAAASLLAGSLSLAGCGDAESNTATGTNGGGAAQQAESPAKPATQPIIPIVQLDDWCREHAMPESICVQCNPSLAAGFKAKGDWDEPHGVPKSQCFQCDPSLKEKFAVAYRSKHGKDAPTGGDIH